MTKPTHDTTSPTSSFGQFWQSEAQYLKFTKVPALDLAVFAILKVRAGASNTVPDKIETLAEWSGMNPRTVQRSLSSLVKRGLVKRTRHEIHGGDRGQTWSWTTELIPREEWPVEPLIQWMLAVHFYLKIFYPPPRHTPDGRPLHPGDCPRGTAMRGLIQMGPNCVDPNMRGGYYAPPKPMSTQDSRPHQPMSTTGEMDQDDWREGSGRLATRHNPEAYLETSQDKNAGSALSSENLEKVENWQLPEVVRILEDSRHRDAFAGKRAELAAVLARTPGKDAVQTAEALAERFTDKIDNGPALFETWLAKARDVEPPELYVCREHLTVMTWSETCCGAAQQSLAYLKPGGLEYDAAEWAKIEPQLHRFGVAAG